MTTVGGALNGLATILVAGTDDGLDKKAVADALKTLVGLRTALLATREPKRSDGEYIPVRIKDLESAAQQVHQAYHQDQPNTWRECPRNVCHLFKQIIYGGKDARLNHTEPPVLDVALATTEEADVD